MYLPEHFYESRVEVLHELIKQKPMGLLVTNGVSGLDANHLPFELNTEKGLLGTLEAHVSRNNPVWQDVKDGDEVLAVFRVGDAYISPNSYPSKHETGKQVPTWNYIVVHAHGRVKIRDNEQYVRGVVAKLTRTHEASMPKPWKMTDSPREYIDGLMKLIVGVEVEIVRLMGKFKLGQDDEARDIVGAGSALVARGEPMIGEAMLACGMARKEPAVT
ncbi:transcriptional regulator [Pseudomonas sp. A46]|nr:FMN-binding negative transcriptional regulator [Pseudomonas sp. A46]OWJ98234.1 transcriptional regulator [Pseudomonas sp. A46]